MLVSSHKSKLVCFLILFGFFINKVEGGPVDSSLAKTVASSFYTQTFSEKGIRLTLANAEESTDGIPCYYIYNINTNDGFVIISADDAAYPIIGYSNEGHYYTGKQQPEFKYWMGSYEKQIMYIRSHHLNATTDIQNQWTAYKNNLPTGQNNRISSSVNPLVKTVWDQSPYSNSACPGSCVAGCVATAMAQIMKYWAFPPHGIDTNAYTDPTYGTISAYFDTTHYNWATMPLNVTSSNQQVANLMYDCGVAVNMVYTPSASSSYMILADNPQTGQCSQTAYIKYFGYNGSTIQGLYRSTYANATWISMLENELNNNRPIQYAGSGSDGGHSWVCDGYNTSGDFHMNWGWQGYLDGYFNLNALNPGGTPLDSNEEALIGIEPSPAVAVFTGDPIIIRAGDTVHFTDNSFGSVPITSWLWTFQGASLGNSTLQNPTVTYANPGTYTVSEAVTSSKGNNTLTKTDYIIVLDNNTVNVYPTLNTGTFTIELHDPSLVGSNLQFSLYDVSGQKMYTTTLTQFITTLSVVVPHGMYFYRAFNSSNKPVATGKLVMK